MLGFIPPKQVSLGAGTIPSIKVAAHKWMNIRQEKSFQFVSLWVSRFALISNCESFMDDLFAWIPFEYDSAWEICNITNYTLRYETKTLLSFVIH